MTPNGLPPHVLSWLNDSKIMDGIDGLPSKILGGMGRILQENGVNAGNITKEMLETMMKNLLEADRSNRTATISPSTLPLMPWALKSAATFVGSELLQAANKDKAIPSANVDLMILLMWFIYFLNVNLRSTQK